MGYASLHPSYAGFLVFSGGLKIVTHTDLKQDVSCWQLQEIQKKVYKLNQCTGVIEGIELNQATSNKPRDPVPQGPGT